MLALLAIAEGRLVTVDAPARRAVAVAHSGIGATSPANHMSRLRSHFGTASAVLETGNDGYRLVLRPDELDVAPGAEPARVDTAGRGWTNTPVCRRRIGLWRGPVLADLLDVVPIATAAEEYARMHRDVVDALIAAGIAAGHARDVLPLAAAAAASDPLREPAVLLHMRALAATGEVPQALGMGRTFRRRLVDETGLDPSAALDETEREIISRCNGYNTDREHRSSPPRPCSAATNRSPRYTDCWRPSAWSPSSDRAASARPEWR